MTTINLNRKEYIVRQARANHFYGFEACGGKLYLTNQRLYFKTHQLNINDHELNINLADITDVKFCNTLKIIPNGMIIILKNDKKEQFVINGRKKWRVDILNELSKLS